MAGIQQYVNGSQ